MQTKLQSRKNFITWFLVLVGFFFLPQQLHATSTNPQNTEDLFVAPGINLVDKNNNTTEIPGDYGSFFTPTANTTYEVTGLNPASPSDNAAIGTSGSKVYWFDPDYAASEKSLLIKNAGNFNGEDVDLKLVIDEINVTPYSSGEMPKLAVFAISYLDYKNNFGTTIPGISFSGIKYGDAFLTIGFKSSPSLSENSSMKYHYEIYYAGTQNRVSNYKGVWNFTNLNKYKTLDIPHASGSDFSKFFIYNQASLPAGSYTLGYERDTPNVGELRISSDNPKVGAVNNDQALMTRMIDGNELHMSMTKRGVGGGMAIQYVTQPIARIAPATPIVIGQKNSAVFTEADYEKLKYRILQNIADNKVENRDNSVSIVTTVPNQYEFTTENISKLTIVKYGTTENLKDLFDIAVDPTNSSKLILKAKDSTSDAFAGNVFDISVEASRKASIPFDITLDNYQATGADAGYMLYEMGESTSTSYSYTKAGIVDKALNSVKDDNTISKVLHQGIPYADAKVGLTIGINTDIKTKFPDPNSLIENLRIDTGESAEDVTITYQETGPIISSNTPGAINNVVVVLETKDSIKNTVSISLTSVEVSGTLTINFENEIGNVLNDYTLTAGETGGTAANHIETPISIGDVLDLTMAPFKNKIQEQIDKLQAAGYEVASRPSNEAAFPITTADQTVTYKVKGTLSIKSAPAVDFGVLTFNSKVQEVTNPTLTGDSLSVLDTRSSGTSGWTLSAKLTQEMTNASTTSVMGDALHYIKEDGTDITLTSADSPIVVKNAGGSEVVSDKWNTTNGLKLVADPSKTTGSNIGNYIGEITWTVTVGP